MIWAHHLVTLEVLTINMFELQHISLIVSFQVIVKALSIKILILVLLCQISCPPLLKAILCTHRVIARSAATKQSRWVIS
jgi:hypothetical protein